MLQSNLPEFYIVKCGQTLASIAAAFGLPLALIIRENALVQEVYDGQILKLPRIRGNLYTARAGDGKRLLCGSEENFEKKNGTKILYPGMRVML